MASFKGFSFRSMTPSSNGNEAGRLVTGCRQAFTSWDPNHVTIMLPMAAKDPDTGDFAPFKQGAGDESDFGPVIMVTSRKIWNSSFESVIYRPSSRVM